MNIILVTPKYMVNIAIAQLEVERKKNQNKIKNKNLHKLSITKATKTKVFRLKSSNKTL